MKIEEKIDGFDLGPEMQELPIQQIADELRKQLAKCRRGEFGKKLALEWRNVSFSIKGKPILTDCYGKIQPGQVTALIGPSGAGKSTLINLLAGRQNWEGANLKFSGTIRYGGKKVTMRQLQESVGYVPQYDTLLGTETVLETLNFAAQLRLPETGLKIKKNVEELLSSLELSHVKDVLVGDALIKGISGGQRKRVSTCCELVTRPSILFLDEPTSGLDSYASLQLITLLKKLAKEQNAIICATIHQPSSELFGLFDRVICMRFGEILYQGLSGVTADEFREKWGATNAKTIALVPDFMAKIARKPVPEGFNTCDWLLYQAQAQSEEEIREDIELTVGPERGGNSGG